MEIDRNLWKLVVSCLITGGAKMLKRVKIFLGVSLVSWLIVIKAGISFSLPIVEITYNITGPVNGIWTYNYTLRNIGTETIWLWDIYPTVTVSDITKPSADWYILTDYSSWIEWSCPFPGTGISPNNSLSGFSYKSSGPPGWIRYEVESTLGGIASGLTMGATPEPSSLILFASGIFIGIRILRKKFLLN
jgi:hypothetical protein